jgi:ABC-type cobalamin transport system permease subunit
MNNRVLMSGITLGIITGSVMILREYFQRKKINKSKK